MVLIRVASHQRDPPDLTEVHKGTERIIEAGTRASEIIGRLRSLYKKAPPQRELVDVNGIIHEMLALLEGEAFRLSVAMRTDFSVELPKIMVDRVQLQQVFMNLMLNAIEAMKDAGGGLTVKSELQDGQLQLSVSDTGVGLPTEKMDQIFSAFFTTKPKVVAWDWPSAVPSWSRTADSCGQCPMKEGGQLFISPYRSRPRSHRPWLPDAPAYRVCFCRLDFQWRQSLEDGVYAVPGFLIRAADGSRARFVGHRPGTEIRWQANRHLWYQADYGIFYAGSFLKETKPGRNLNYWALWVGYKF